MPHKGRLAHNLKVARAASGQTQEEVARLVGVSKQSVSAWERGAADPSEENLESLAKIYDTTLATLRYGEGADVLNVDSAGRYTLVDDRAGGEVKPSAVNPSIGDSPSFTARARAFINRFLAEIAEAGATEEQEAAARRMLMNPDNYTLNVGGQLPTDDDDALLRDIEGMSIGIRRILIARGLKNLNPK